MTAKQHIIFYLRLAGILLVLCMIAGLAFWGPILLCVKKGIITLHAGNIFHWKLIVLFVLFIILLVSLILLALYKIVFNPIKKIVNRMNDILIEDPYSKASESSFFELQSPENNVNGFLKFFSDSQQTIGMLFHISKIITSSIDMEELITAVLAILSQYFENIYCCMIHMDIDGYLKVKSFRGFSTETMRLIRYRPGEGTIGKIYSTLKPVIINNTEQEGDGLIALMRDRDKIESLLFIPLSIENQTLGILGVGSRESSYFTQIQIKKFITIADYVAIAIRNSKFYEQLQIFNRRLEAEVSSTTQELTHTNTRLIKKVRELKILYDILMAISITLNIDDVMISLMDKIPDLIDAELFHFIRFDKKSNSLESFRLMIGQKIITQKDIRIGVAEESVVSKVFKTGETFLSNAVNRSQCGSWGIPLSYAVKSMICFPVRTQFETVGVFCIGNKTLGQFNQDDVRVLHLLINHLGEVIENISLYHENEKRVADLLMLQRISSTISSSPILSVTLKNITHIIADALQIDYCVFLLYDESVGDLVPQVGFHGNNDIESKQMRINISDKTSISARVFREGKSFSTGPCFSEKNNILMPGQDAEVPQGSLMVIPLKVENEIIGILRVGSKQENYFSADHQRLADLIADQSAIIIENAKLYQRIRDAVRELEQLNKMKNEFIAVISHELRTPITTISGFVNILLKEDAGHINAKQKRFLEITDQSVRRLMELLNDILDISRIETGRIYINFVSASIQDLLKQVVRHFEPECKMHKIALTLKISDHLPKVSIDKDRMIQVFKHLIQNAVKFTDPNGKISVHAQDRGDFLQIEVSDTGIGIEERNFEKIFEKFYQVDMSSSRRSGGTGLGLSIVKSIVELHGGKIWVESKIGAGSSFKLIIPKVKKEREHI
ncbi:MAG: GAF domain-containing protein [bacterium]